MKRSLFPKALLFTTAALLAVGLASACKRETSPPPPPAAPDATTTATTASAGDPLLPGVPNADNPPFCAPCHGKIYEEWKQSMHSRAHHLRDPIYAGIRKMRIAREGPDLAKACAQCHSPRSVEDPESEIAKLGVSCASCHNVSKVEHGEGLFGAKALVKAEGDLMVGPYAPDSLAVPHPIGEAPAHMKDGVSLCLACHEKMSGQHGIPVCTTGIEWDTGAKKGRKTCVDCHMPTVEGPAGEAKPQRVSHRSHAFVGPHRAWLQRDTDLLKSAVDIQAVIEGRKLIVTLHNQSQHDFPSGFPGRFAALQVIGQDANDKPIWHNFETNPMKESPESVFNKVYVDDKDQPSLAPYATKLKRDSRLKVGETRKLEYTLPDGVDHAVVKLFFRLVAPPLAARLGLSQRREGTGKVIALLVVRKTAKP